MATHMSAFADIAARYGVDRADDEAVDRFFDEVAPSLPEIEREKILSELLAAQAKEGDSPARLRYASGSPDPTIDERSPAPVPLRAVHPVRDAAELKSIASALQTCVNDFLALAGLDVLVDVVTSDEGRLECVLAGREALRLPLDDPGLLRSIRYLVKRVAAAQESVENAEVIVHGASETRLFEETGGMKLQIVRMQNIAIEPMTVRAAASRLHSSPNEFIVFRDEDTDQVSVLYKRWNRQLGLIC